MKIKDNTFTSKQLLFQEIFIGTLIYTVILGLFNDYTSIVYAKSFSTILFSATILELLTYLAFLLKKKKIAKLKDRTGLLNKVIMFFCVWFIMFSSKFIFVWALDLIIGSHININGFFGILAVVLGVTITQKLAYRIFNKLG